MAHFQAEMVVHNLLREMAGEAAEPLAEGHVDRFVETGFGNVILIEFNYDIQPVPGKFRLPPVGPMTLLQVARLNHLGKLAFKPIYGHMLLPGRIHRHSARPRARRESLPPLSRQRAVRSRGFTCRSPETRCGRAPPWPAPGRGRICCRGPLARDPAR